MTQEQKIIRVKAGLLELAKQLGNLSQACKMMGYSRDGFYRFKEQYDKGGELALQEISRRKPILKDRTPIAIEEAAVALAIEQPAWGQVRVSDALKWRGLSISPAGVRCVWQRHDLASMKQRSSARSQGGAGWHSLDRGPDRRARESQGRQGSPWRVRERVSRLLRGFYVGTLKGVGRIYQQTFIDTYAKVAFAKLYDRKTPITAAEILNDRVVPFGTCIVHLLRHSLDFVSWKDGKPVAAALKDIYRAVDAAAGEAALAAFEDGPWARNTRKSPRAGGAPGARSPRSMSSPP
jgi:hypothetical protein